MAEIIVIEILVSIGVISLITYVIFTALRKNLRFDRAYEEKRETIRQEKELDRTDAITRGLHLIRLEKKQMVK